jgi:hypothetical protein
MRMHRLFAGALLTTSIASLSSTALAQANENELRWVFSREQNASPVDAVRGIQGMLEGKYSYVPGVTGDALRLDGYTTSMTVAAKALPSIGPDGFTVEAWVALNTYPWNWVPIADQQIAHEAGFFFGIDAFGHVGLEASFNGQWRSAVSKATVPLKRLRVYMNGAALVQLPVEGEYSPAKADLLTGVTARSAGLSQQRL